MLVDTIKRVFYVMKKPTKPINADTLKHYMGEMKNIRKFDLCKGPWIDDEEYIKKERLDAERER